jgi:hypothetical protein
MSAYYLQNDLKIPTSASRKYGGVLQNGPKWIPLAFFLKLPQIGLFWTSRHFSTDSGPMLDLITWTCSKWTPTSTVTII